MNNWSVNLPGTRSCWLRAVSVQDYDEAICSDNAASSENGPTDEASENSETAEEAEETPQPDPATTAASQQYTRTPANMDAAQAEKNATTAQITPFLRLPDNNLYNCGERFAALHVPVAVR